MPCSWSTQEFCPLIHTTREAELSKEQSEGASRRSRAVLHVRRDGQESLSTARLLPHDSPDVGGHAHVGQCRNLTPSSCPRASREPEPARGHGQRHTAVTQAEDPWVIEVFGDTTITLDIGLACADAYAVLARKGAKAAVVMDHRDTVAGVLVDSEHVACGATRHLGGQETDDCSCASDVHQAEGQTQTTAVAPLGCVGDFMRPCQITVTGDTLLSEAASTMADHSLPWLPVITCRGDVMGLLSAMDVVRWVGEFTGALPGARPGASSAPSLAGDERRPGLPVAGLRGDDV